MLRDRIRTDAYYNAIQRFAASDIRGKVRRLEQQACGEVSWLTALLVRRTRPAGGSRRRCRNRNSVAVLCKGRCTARYGCASSFPHRAVESAASRYCACLLPGYSVRSRSQRHGRSSAARGGGERLRRLHPRHQGKGRRRGSAGKGLLLVTRRASRSAGRPNGGAWRGAGGRDRVRVDGLLLARCATLSLFYLFTTQPISSRLVRVSSDRLADVQENMLPTVVLARDKWLKPVRRRCCCVHFFHD
jgi:hypothetical protein